MGDAPQPFSSKGSSSRVDRISRRRIRRDDGTLSYLMYTAAISGCFVAFAVKPLDNSVLIQFASNVAHCYNCDKSI